MKDFIPVWIAAGGAVVAAIIAAVTAACLAPLFQHGIWKKQKLREQRLETAKQFLICSRILPVLWYEGGTVEEVANRVQSVMDMKGTLACARVLFEDPGTREWLDKLQARMLEERELKTHWENTHVAREEVVARLFAEALGRKVDPNWFHADPKA